MNTHDKFSNPSDPNEGERRTEDVLEKHESRRPVYVNRGRRALLQRLLSDGEATANAWHHAVPLPPDVDPRCFGAVPGPLVRAGIIQSDGYLKVKLPKGDTHVVCRWLLVDRDAAECWLRNHPDEPDLGDDQENPRNRKEN